MYRICCSVINIALYSEQLINVVFIDKLTDIGLTVWYCLSLMRVLKLPGHCSVLAVTHWRLKDMLFHILPKKSLILSRTSARLLIWAYSPFEFSVQARYIDRYIINYALPVRGFSGSQWVLGRYGF